MSAAPMDPPKTALVLGGGGARGAYEAGVLAYLRQELEPKLGPLRMDIVCGTSVGAINACHVAANIEHPVRQAADLMHRWRSLAIESVLRFGFSDLVRITRELLGRPTEQPHRHGGVMDPAGLRQIVLEGAHWPSIGRSIRRGALEALAVTATHVATGHSEVFIQQRGGGLPPWTRDPHLIASAARIGPHHALASAAIPLIFPAVSIGGRLYVDGGLRMNVPLSPALRLGAERVLVISLRHIGSTPEPSLADSESVERTSATAPFLLGKTLNALLLDRTDQDLERLQRINTMLEAGVAAYGTSYPEVFNAALLPRRNQGVRYVRNFLIRPSRDIGELAAEYASSPEFNRRARGWVGKGLRRLAERQGPRSEDLLSYLLFDGGFADLLIDLGRRDARAREADWVKFWSDAPQSEAEAVQREMSPRAGKAV